MRALIATTALAFAALTAPTSHAGPTCETSPVPAAYDVRGVTDDGARVRLDLLLLLDGIPLDNAKRTVATMTAAYAPLGLDIVVHRYRTVAIEPDGTMPDGRPTGEIARLVQAMKDLTGGARPKGTDAVLMLTDKALWIPGPDGQPQYGWSGTAECLGGVRWPEEAYALSHGDTDRTEMSAHQAAVTLTHELGHLLGAEHQHANCVEGPPPRPCTVMLAAAHSRVDVNSTTFGTLEGAVVRGHAVDFARP